MTQSISGQPMLDHAGHAVEIKLEGESVLLQCTDCATNLLDINLVEQRERRRQNSKERMARMRVEEPERYRAINREKAAKRRARAKSDPEKYANYLAKAKEYNDRAIAKRKSKETA